VPESLLALSLYGWELRFPPVVALAIVAAVGYLVGRSGRARTGLAEVQVRHEVRRAQVVARELDRVAAALRAHLTQHQTAVVRFKSRLEELHGRQTEEDWKRLCREAETVLRPTMKLATQVAQAYDEIRQQSAHLMSFTDARTDPLTATANRRALEEALAAQVALRARYRSVFSLVLLDLDHFKRVNDERGHLTGDRVLQQVARALEAAVRETDLVARYGGEEFVVLMPQTDLANASRLAQRLRRAIARATQLTVSGGVAMIGTVETAEELLQRADAALYQAKAAGRDAVYRHNGTEVEAVPELDATDAQPVAKP
jgi:diguanylate cyclase (GGDEF)-like protein